ncbi:MAG: hypothetical protein ACE37H_11170 [Phycisphaeraceae bacterium]
MAATLDNLMETASQALAEMDYARCEARCVEALEQARAGEDWVTAQRVLLPLQEARRQKRQTAIDGLILLGTPEKAAGLQSLIADERCGCVMLTRPYTAEDAAKLDAWIRGTHRAIEVGYADNDVDADTWRIATFRGAEAQADLPAPDRAWVGRWVDPLTVKPPTPAHWFMRASEALGDAAMARVDAPLGSVERFNALDEALASAGDHELLHQRLGEAAKALQEARR